MILHQRCKSYILNCDKEGIVVVVIQSQSQTICLMVQKSMGGFQVIHFKWMVQMVCLSGWKLGPGSDWTGHIFGCLARIDRVGNLGSGPNCLLDRPLIVVGLGCDLFKWAGVGLRLRLSWTSIENIDGHLYRSGSNPFILQA